MEPIKSKAKQVLAVVHFMVQAVTLNLPDSCATRTSAVAQFIPPAVFSFVS
ncbi:MAG: hypothetical protein ACPGLV_09110 [Bacteroidia bacterium]